MANSRLVVKGGVNSTTQVNGFSNTRYENCASAYGTIAAGTYTKGDFFYFGQVPSKKIIHAVFTTHDATPVVARVNPGYNLANPVSITATAGTAIAVDYVIFYDSAYSGTAGQTLILQVN